MLLGFGLALQVRSTEQTDGLSTARESDLVRILDDLTSRNERLAAEQRDLQATRDRLASGGDTSTTALQEARLRAQTLGILAGTLAAQGPGVVLTVTDPTGKIDAATLLDVVEELRDAGAEAIQVGDVRIVASDLVRGRRPGRPGDRRAHGQRALHRAGHRRLAHPCRRRCGSRAGWSRACATSAATASSRSATRSRSPPCDRLRRLSTLTRPRARDGAGRSSIGPHGRTTHVTHIPDHLQYTAEHEWVDGPDGDGIVTFGITDFAQDALGDIVYVSLPAVDAQVVAGEPCGEVESTKSVSELYAPVSGVVTARNDALDGDSRAAQLRPVRRRLDGAGAGRRRGPADRAARRLGVRRPHGLLTRSRGRMLSTSGRDSSGAGPAASRSVRPGHRSSGSG